jgi:hypothetical protein
MVSEAGAGETTILAKQPVVDSTLLTKVVIMVGRPAKDTVGASAVLDMALVLASTSSPSQRLAEDVVLEFDATHRLSKLTMAWEGLLVGAASFGEPLLVGIFSLFFLVVWLLFVPSLCYFSSLLCKGIFLIPIQLLSLGRSREEIGL